MKTALLQIDWQQAFLNEALGERAEENAEENALQILHFCRQQNIPVYHVQHASTEENSFLHPSQDGFHLQKELQPIIGEKLFVKRVNAAFIGTNLHETLQRDGIEQLIVTGMTTNHCVSTTVRMAGNLGYDVILVKDAVNCFGTKSITQNDQWIPASDVHAIHLASLHNEFCTVMDTNTILSKKTVTR